MLKAMKLPLPKRLMHDLFREICLSKILSFFSSSKVLNLNILICFDFVSSNFKLDAYTRMPFLVRFSATRPAVFQLCSKAIFQQNLKENDNVNIISKINYYR